MPIIPLKHSVTITRFSETGDWGAPIGNAEVFTLRCRIDEGSRLARTTFAGLDASAAIVRGEEVIEVTSILLDKYADIRYTDTLTFNDAGGRPVEAKPVKISVISGINGKPILTEVIV